MKINKLVAVLTSIWFSVLMLIKKVLALVLYLFAYPLKDWVYGNDVIQNYKMPEGVKTNWIKWFFWLPLDDDQITGYSLTWAVKTYGRLPETKWERFRTAYHWSAWRNPMYNINYVYFGNQSEILLAEKAFGNYVWDRKLRSSNGDNGYQLVWFLTEKRQSRFIFSFAKQPFRQPVTFYFGWNPNFNGRFTVAFKLK